MTSKVNIWTEELIVNAGNLIVSYTNGPPPHFKKTPVMSTEDNIFTVLKYKTENMSIAGLNITIDLTSGDFPSWNKNINMSKDIHYNYYDTGIPTNVDHFISESRVLTNNENNENNWTELTFYEPTNCIQLAGPRSCRAINTDKNASTGVLGYFKNSIFTISKINSVSNEKAESSGFDIILGKSV